MNDLQRIKLIIGQRFHLYATDKVLKDADVKLDLCHDFLQEIDAIEYRNERDESVDRYINLASESIQDARLALRMEFDEGYDSRKNVCLIALDLLEVIDMALSRLKEKSLERETK